MIATVVEKQPELTALCEQFGVQRLEIFGSAAAEDRFDPLRSDIDFIVEFHPHVEMGPWLSHYFEFRDSLEKLFGLPVDLVMASAMTKPRFIREANRTRRILYGI